MQCSRSVGRTAAFNVVASVVILALGLAGGAAAGVLSGLPGSSQAPPLEATSRIAGFAPAEPANESADWAMGAGELTVEEAHAAPPVVRTVRRVVTKAGTGPRSSPSAGVGAGTVDQSAVSSVPQVPIVCDRLDDAKIHWLLDLVAKTKKSNPDQAAVADRVDHQLRGALGQNMCAAEAQVHIGNMCVDPAVRKFMGLMVKELPFFVRPLVGDPCTQDLVAAANKWMP